MSLFSDISRFNRSNLNPVTTTVRENAVVGVSGAHSTAPGTGYGHVDAANVREYYDEPALLREKVERLAALLRDARHAVVYTGAGISTAAKIPDYRGPQGVWTLADKGLRPSGGVKLDQATPTYAHMAVAAMHSAGLVRHVVSTNLDGLHLRSGLSPASLSELHGNCYKETCKACGAIYVRSFDCTVAGCRADHLTGRKCDKPGCAGPLVDSVVNFGETLPDTELTPALEQSRAADLALVLGTSMLVRPACDLPRMCVQSGGKMVICNKQKTPYDSEAALVIHGDLDDVMALLCERFGLAVPERTPPTELWGEGFPVPRPDLRLDEKYREYRRRNAVEPRLAVHALRLSAKTLTLDGPNRAPNPALHVAYFRNPSDDVTIDERYLKVFLDNCCDCRVSINVAPVVNTVELVRCRNLTVVFNVPIATVTVDMSADCTLVFPSRGHLHALYSNQCSGLRVSTAGFVSLLPVDSSDHSSPAHWEDTQHLTSWDRDQERIVTEPVVREGAGYPTTERAKAAADARQQRNDAALEHFLKFLSGPRDLLQQPKQ